MPVAPLLGSRAGRLYFALQSTAGACWWVGVFLSDGIRAATLGDLDPVLVAAFDIPLFVIASALIACGLRALVWIVAPWTALVTAGMALYATFTGLAGWGVLIMVAATAGSVAAGLLVLLGRLPSEWLLRGPFALKPASPASPRTHVMRTTTQLIVFWGLFLVVVPIVIVFVEHRWNLELAIPAAVRGGGVVLLVAASALGVWSAIAMSTRGEGTPLPSATARLLVIAGPYRFVRNPMAIAGIVQGVAVGMMAGSWLVVIYALSGSLVWNWVIRPLEEADLAARFGVAYDEYARVVGCWMPRLRPYRGAAMNIR